VEGETEADTDAVALQKGCCHMLVKAHEEGHVHRVGVTEPEGQ